jgi:hypothetical protein
MFGKKESAEQVEAEQPEVKEQPDGMHRLSKREEKRIDFSPKLSYQRVGSKHVRVEYPDGSHREMRADEFAKRYDMKL